MTYVAHTICAVDAAIKHRLSKPDADPSLQQIQAVRDRVVKLLSELHRILPDTLQHAHWCINIEFKPEDTKYYTNRLLADASHAATLAILTPATDEFQRLAPVRIGPPVPAAIQKKMKALLLVYNSAWFLFHTATTVFEHGTVLPTGSQVEADDGPISRVTNNPVTRSLRIELPLAMDVLLEVS